MDPDTVKEIACTLPLPVIEHLWRQPVADVARKTLTVDVVDLISELEQHTADRLLQKKWLTTIQAFAVAPTIAAATRSVSTPPPNSAKNVCGDDTKSSPASPSKGTPLHTQGGAFGIAAAALNPLAMTIRRADVEAVLLEASSTSQDGKVYLASSATREEGNDEASAAVKRQLLASPAAAPARINDDDVPDVDDDDGGNSPPSFLKRNGGHRLEDAALFLGDAMSSNLTSCPPEVFVVMNNQRCRQSHTPLMQDRFHPTEALLRDSSAWSLYERAEHMLENAFQIGISFEDASLVFSRAGREFDRGEDAAVMAGNCFVRAADCRRCVCDFDAEAELLVDAAEAYARGDASPRCKHAAVAALRDAVRIYEKEERPMKSAKHARQAAEYAVDGGMLLDAITLLHYAANVYHGRLRMPADARVCLARATAVCVMDAGNYLEAIACLEKTADICQSEKEQAFALFRALVCRMACVPPGWGAEAVEAIHDIRDVFNSYSDCCSALLIGPENDCIEQALAGLLAEDPDKVESAFGKYVRSHTLEEWVEPLFWAIHASALQRKSQHLRLYTL